MVDDTHVGDPVETRMSHLVVYGAGDGSWQYLMAASLPEAVAHTEHLVNDRRNDSARIFELREVAIDYKHYYRIEVAGDEPQVASPAAPSPLGSKSQPHIAALPA